MGCPGSASHSEHGRDFDLPPIVALGIYLGDGRFAVVVAGALVDIAVAWIDPRIRRPRAWTKPNGEVTLDPLSPMTEDLDFRDGPRDECGVFGVQILF